MLEEVGADAIGENVDSGIATKHCGHGVWLHCRYNERGTGPQNTEPSPEYRQVIINFKL